MKKIVTCQDLTSEEGFDIHWQSSAADRFTLLGVLRRLKPKLALEIGTYLGGSLQAISRYSEKVISIDIDPSVPIRLKERFSNVVFRTGDSKVLLPQVVKEINASTEELSFVLIDGDHYSESVRRDVQNLLGLVPKTTLVFIMHDSFNPDCRRGIMSVEWDKSPYVQSVELDFVTGYYFHEPYDQAEARTMWGGFACAILTPETRIGPLRINELQRHAYQAVKSVSIYGRDNTWNRRLRKLKQFIKK